MAHIERDSLMGGRADFGRLLNERGLRRNAVEIGTDRGHFAREFMDNWLGEQLFCVDTYSTYTDMPWVREMDRMAAVLHLQPHLKRVRFMQMSSAAASSAFTFGKGVVLPLELDFVYIDGDHREDFVLEDMAMWWPLLKTGGVLAGDDFGNVHPGVRRAVNQFADARAGGIVHTVHDYNREPNWYLWKV